MAALPMHKHPSYSFIISFSDTSIIQLPHGKINTKPNTIYFLSPFVPHHEICEVGLPRYLGVFISPDFLQEQAVSYKQYNLSFDETAAFPATDELLLVIKRFIRECKQKQAGYACMLESLSVKIAHALLRSMLNLQDNNYSHVSRIEINRSIEYMRQNISEKLSLSILASFAGMSVSHFSTSFHKKYNISPSEYLSSIKER
ncbi:MAG: AraC family transcriptional regulator [Bacteroidales bacterium]|jgi:hypothetical protein